MAHPDKHIDPFTAFIHEKMNEKFAKAPEELWTAIGQELDQDVNLLDDQLQETFAGFQVQAPESIWDNIEEELTTALDQKVKTAYSEASPAPEKIWLAIDQQLNVNQIWYNMQPQLNKLKTTYLWRKRIGQISVAALFLLLFRTCGPGLSLFPTAEQSAHNHSNQQTAEPVQKTTTTPLSGNSKTLTQQKIAPAKKPVAAIMSNIKVTSTPNQEKTTIALLKKASRPLETVSTEPNGANGSNPSSPTVERALRLRSNELQQPNFELAQKTTLALNSLPTLHEPTFSNSNSKLSNRLSVGVILAVHNSFLTNDATAKNIVLQNASNVDPQLPISNAYGVQVDYRLKKNQALSAELWLNSEVRQSYNFLYQGNMFNKEILLNYFKGSIAYKMGLLKGQDKHQLNLKTGAYLARLKNIEFNYPTNAAAPNLRPLDYSNWDSGLLLALSQQHKLLDCFSLEYGLRTEFGFGNIFANQQQLPSNTPTRLINLGVFLSMSYAF